MPSSLPEGYAYPASANIKGDAMSATELSVSFPLDSQGFLRRACSACDGEFKWLSVEADAASPVPEEYFCPYCGASAAPNNWFTLEQLAYIESAVFDEVLGPSLEELSESVRQLNRSSGGLIEVNASIELPERRQAPPVFEPDDMRQVTFSCHPKEPIKVDEAWRRPVHCLCCGQLSDATS